MDYPHCEVDDMISFKTSFKTLSQIPGCGLYYENPENGRDLSDTMTNMEDKKTISDVTLISLTLRRINMTLKSSKRSPWLSSWRWFVYGTETDSKQMTLCSDDLFFTKEITKASTLPVFNIKIFKTPSSPNDPNEFNYHSSTSAVTVFSQQ